MNHATEKTELSFYSVYRKCYNKIVVIRKDDQSVCSQKKCGVKSIIEVCQKLIKILCYFPEFCDVCCICQLFKICNSS